MSTDPGAELGGARTHVLGVIEAFESLGWEVHRYIAGDRVPRSWRAAGFERSLRTGPLHRLAADGIRLAMGPIAARAARRQMAGRVDWVYERSASFQSLGPAFQQQGIPWILEVNAPLFYESRVDRKSLVLKRLARRLEVRAYRDCDVLITVSEALKEMLFAEAGIPSHKVLVVPCGVDPGYYDPASFAPIRLFPGRTVVYAGWLVPWQGVGQLLEALHQISQEATWNLVVVGDGPSRQEWERKAAALGLWQRVAFVGLVSRHEVPRFIAGADLGFVGPTPLEIGFMYHSPLKLYEYMAMGKPVLAAAYADARRAVAHGQTGFLFQPSDIESLIQALREAHQAARRLDRMGRQARKEAMKHHSWRARVLQLIGGVDEMLKDRRRCHSQPAESGFGRWT